MVNSPGTTDFLSTQLSTIQRLEHEQAQRQQLKSQRGTLQRNSGGGGGGNRLGRGSNNLRSGGLSTIADR